MMSSTARAFALACLLPLAVGACGPFPRDAAGSTERAAAGVVRVGASHDPPHLVLHADGPPSGDEAALVERFAAARGWRVEWITGGHESLMRQLAGSRLHLVAGGHVADSPWKATMGWSREYPLRDGADGAMQLRRLALPPGESRWQMLVDRHLVAREDAR